MRSISMIIFFTVFFAVYSLANIYIYIRGYQALSNLPQLRLPYIITFIVLASAYLVSRFLERTNLFLIHDGLYWIGSFWFAIMLYAFLATVLADFTRLLNMLFHFLPEKQSSAYVLLKQIVFFTTFSIIAILLVYGYWNARHPGVKSMEMQVNKSAGERKELKIAMVSDIHMGVLFGKRRMEKMVRDINALKPDIILLAGDILDEVQRPIFYHQTGEPLKKLSAPLGVYGITGNHEYIGGIKTAVNYIESLGIKLLRDTVVLIGNSFYLAGRDDKDEPRFNGKNRKELNEILCEGQIDPAKPLILMDHQPFKLEQAVKNGVDLQLSGHTHHGQFWPINYITSKTYEVSWGYKKKENTHVYVSCGYGFWGPPIRIGNKPEIVNIMLKFRE